LVSSLKLNEFYLFELVEKVYTIDLKMQVEIKISQM